MKTIHTSKPFTSNPKNSPAYWLLDILWVVHAAGEQTQGSYSMIEQWQPYGAGPPPHVHPYADESFWVIEGEMTVEVGGKTLVLGPGSLGHVPRNAVHSFKVTSKAVCHMLNYYTPAGFEQCLIGSARPAKRRELPPPGLDPPRFAPGRPVLRQLLGRPGHYAVGDPEARPRGVRSHRVDQQFLILNLRAGTGNQAGGCFREVARSNEDIIAPALSAYRP